MTAVTRMAVEVPADTLDSAHIITVPNSPKITSCSSSDLRKRVLHPKRDDDGWGDDSRVCMCSRKSDRNRPMGPSDCLWPDNFRSQRGGDVGLDGNPMVLKFLDTCLCCH